MKEFKEVYINITNVREMVKNLPFGQGTWINFTDDGSYQEFHRLVDEQNKKLYDYIKCPSMKLPPHNSLFITHNEHKTSYETVEEYIKTWEHKDISPEELKLCSELDEIWEIQLYPRTPISFHYVAASTFEKALELIWKECS